MLVPDDFGERLQAATEVLEALVADRSLLQSLPLEQRTRLLNAAGDVYSPDVEERRRQIKAQRRQQKQQRTQRDQGALEDTGIRVARSKPVFSTPNVFAPALAAAGDRDDTDDFDAVDALELQHCYICKRKYSQIDAFYDQMCPECAAFNFAKRAETADLSGRVALLTGGRVKIGYQAGIKLLRAGARLVVTTRFPRDSAQRYAAEADFATWGHRLEIFGLDLRHTPSVEAFCQHLLDTHDRLDFIINNACQTVRRPPDFYRHMMAGEAAAFGSLSTAAASLLGVYEGLRGYDAVHLAANAL